VQPRSEQRSAPVAQSRNEQRAAPAQSRGGGVISELRRQQSDATATARSRPANEARPAQGSTAATRTAPSSSGTASAVTSGPTRPPVSGTDGRQASTSSGGNNGVLSTLIREQRDVADRARGDRDGRDRDGRDRNGRDWDRDTNAHRDGNDRRDAWRDRDSDRDRRHRHVHVVNTLPYGYRDYSWNGSRYYYHDGYWYRPYGSTYITVGIPYGLFVTTLPGSYTSFWFGSTRYYYSDYHYYTYEPVRRGYVVVRSPYGDDYDYETEDAVLDEDIFIYPAEGQSEQQQADDRYECHRWAVSQTDYDPIDDEYDAALREDYIRAITACLTGRGYTVR